MMTREQVMLSEFVDRDPEFKHFCDMLDAARKPVFVLWASGGLGKTWLISKLVAECNQRGRCAVLVNEHHHVNYLSVFREIRDKVGGDHFSKFTALVDFFAGKIQNVSLNIAHTGPINVFPNASIDRSKVGDVAGVIVKEVNLTAPRDGIDVPEGERMIRLTQQFIEDFEGALAERPVVVFFDAAEKMPQVTREWLWETLFGNFLAADRIGKARFVLAGREKPTYNRDLSFLVEERQLGPLDEQNIEAYLAKRGVSEEHRHELALMLLGTAHGQPNLVAIHTDRYLALKQASGL